MFFVTDSHQKPSFVYRMNGNDIELHAEPGAGINAARATLRWDIDGDGRPDNGPDGKPLEGQDVKVRAGDVGGRVTLWIQDPVSQKTIAVTRTIKFDEPATPASNEVTP